MSDRHQDQVNQRGSQLLTVLEPQLLPGERVELLSFAMVGKTPAKKNAAVLAVSAAAAAATGGTMVTIFARRSYYVILTGQRLLVVANDRRSGGFGTIKTGRTPRGCDADTAGQPLLRQSASGHPRV